MKHLGDITKLNGYELPIVDIITGGSPCQDLSVAGKRAGLAGERSGLFMEQIRIIKEMREHDRIENQRTDKLIRPRYMVWENVPGAFSSNGGEDFRAVLEETAKVADENAVIPRLERGARWSHSGCIMGNGWSIAWRLHDAQFWGVPQRRKRIALVADFGGLTAPEILFERKGLSRDIEESGEERKETTRTLGGGPEEAGGTISFQERAGCEGGARESLSNTNGQEPCQQSTTKLSCNWDGTQTASTLTANNAGGGSGCPTNRTLMPSLCIGGGQLHDAMSPSIEVSKTLNCMDDPMKVVCLGIDRASFNQGQNALYDFQIDNELAQTIVAKGAGGVLTRKQ